MYGYIYLTTNLINGKKYVGKHKSSEFDPSYKGSGKIICQAILKYGEENFKVELSEACETSQELNTREYEIIRDLDAINSREYYNLRDGGFGGWKVNGVSIKKGVTVSEDARRNISLAHLGKSWSDKQRSARAGMFQGENNPFYGKDFSEETKKLLSKIRRGRVWVNNGVSETNCKPEDLDSYEELGYVRGRLKSSTSEFAKSGNYKFAWMTKDKIDKKVRLDEVEDYLSQGYVRGRYNWTRRRATTIESIAQEKDLSEEASRVDLK